MPDATIFYDRADIAKARRLYEILSREFDVFWDGDVGSEDYREAVERATLDSRCVVPLWSAESRMSRQVIDEVGFAADHGISVVSTRLEEVRPPTGFGGLNRIELLDWDGYVGHPGIAALRERIARECRRELRMADRPMQIDVSGVSVLLPGFVFSVSSHETALPPPAALQALAIAGTDSALVSAFDIVRSNDGPRIREAVRQLRAHGTTLFLDSGNYEASRKADRDWSADELRGAFGVGEHFAFVFDDIRPPADVDEAVRRIIEATVRERTRTEGAVVPIVHAPRAEDGIVRSELLAEMLTRVAEETEPPIVAVPERELGPGLWQRCRTVQAIRNELDKLGRYQPLHLLGTGNPISIAALAGAGADLFDGLEWCRTVADHSTGTLYHFHQYDIFSWQTMLASNPNIVEALREDNLPYLARVALHNIEFFTTWIAEVRTHILNGTIDRFLADKLPKGATALRDRDRVLNT